MSLSEKDRAIKLANTVLERPNADPDDDLVILSRQLLRALEQKHIGYPSSVRAHPFAVIHVMREEEESKPMTKSGPAIEGCEIAVINSITPRLSPSETLQAELEPLPDYEHGGEA